MSVQTALDADHPMMVAWNQFKATEEYANALNWALRDKYDDGRYISAEMRKNHVEGAMWFAFTRLCAALRLIDKMSAAELRNIHAEIGHHALLPSEPVVRAFPVPHSVNVLVGSRYCNCPVISSRQVEDDECVICGQEPQNWLIFYEDAGLQQQYEIYTDEIAARMRHKNLSLNWNCHLFKQVNVALSAPPSEADGPQIEKEKKNEV